MATRLQTRPDGPRGPGADYPRSFVFRNRTFGKRSAT